ncbi:MAG: PIN domain-containing protein [Phycisphaerae bacterium]|nr:PIN domain-containing protein [Phycisphaerae bacterium]
MICLDTMVVIWGIQETPAQEELEFRKRTQAYLESLSEKKEGVLIPTPVVHEVLVGIPPDQHSDYLAAMEQEFVVGVFDLLAARLAAEIEYGAVKPKSRDDRIRLRLDAQILAIAIVQGASVVISHDQGMASLASGRIRVMELPSVQRQEEMKY